MDFSPIHKGIVMKSRVFPSNLKVTITSASVLISSRTNILIHVCIEPPKGSLLGKPPAPGYGRSMGVHLPSLLLSHLLILRRSWGEPSLVSRAVAIAALPAHNPPCLTVSSLCLFLPCSLGHFSSGLACRLLLSISLAPRTGSLALPWYRIPSCCHCWFNCLSLWLDHKPYGGGAFITSIIESSVPTVATAW